MKRILKYMAIFASLMFSSTGCLASETVYIQVSRGLRFHVYDFKSSDYSYPAFRFSLKAPDGTIIGWDESRQTWTGTVEETYIRGTEPSIGPVADDEECTSTVEYTGMRFGSPPGIYGDYGFGHAYYCKNIVSGENRFMSSQGGGDIGNTPDGKYELVLLTNKYAVVRVDFSFLIENMDNEGEDESYLIITPNGRQTIDVTYNYTTEAENKLQKVITPALLVGEWEGCNQLGLIRNQGIFTSIDKKLEAAKERCEAGDMKAAANINNAAINEIKAQYGKGIDKLCADILLEDLAFMINK